MSSHPAASSQKSTTVRSNPWRVLLGASVSSLGRIAPGGAALIAERLFLTPTRHARPEGERTLLSSARHLLVPAAASEGGIERPMLSTWTWGDEGPRVLLVHGWEGRGAQLGPLVQPLVEAGFRVVTFDAPAHGDTPGELASLLHFADAIERVCAAHGPFFGMVTHSMGGAAATWAQRERPLAEAMVMLCPPSDVRDFTRKLSEALRLGDDVRERIEARLSARLGVHPAALAVDRVAPSMRAPLLVIHDRDDREVPLRSGELVASSWPGARLVRTSGLGHRRILKDAAVIGEVIGFVQAAREARAA